MAVELTDYTSAAQAPRVLPGGDRVGNTADSALEVPDEQIAVLGSTREPSFATGEPSSSQLRLDEKGTQIRHQLLSEIDDGLAACLDEQLGTPTQTAITRAHEIARRIAGRLTLDTATSAAAFIEESGCVALVLQSNVTDRRANLRISSDGSDIRVIRVDEHMNGSSEPVVGGDIEETIGWVLRRT